MYSYLHPCIQTCHFVTVFIQQFSSFIITAHCGRHKPMGSQQSGGVEYPPPNDAWAWRELVSLRIWSTTICFVASGEAFPTASPNWHILFGFFVFESLPLLYVNHVISLSKIFAPTGSGHLSLSSFRGRQFEYQLWRWVYGGNLASVGWQVKLCDLIWHLSSIVPRRLWTKAHECDITYY